MKIQFNNMEEAILYCVKDFLIDSAWTNESAKVSDVRRVYSAIRGVIGRGMVDFSNTKFSDTETNLYMMNKATEHHNFGREIVKVAGKVAKEKYPEAFTA